MRLASLLVFLVALSGCGDNVEGPGAAWSMPGSELREAIMSIGGTDTDDVWAVGADRGQGALVLHYDGARWSKLETGERASLWWVHAFPDGPVFLAGAKSTILRYENGTFVRMPTIGLSRHTVFGIWGASPNDVYAVGSLGAANGFVWHYDGTAWREVALPDNLPQDELGNTAGLFKVWGDGAGTVWVVGGRGTVLRSRDGGAFEYVPVDTEGTLFTVTGDANRTYMVGALPGHILEAGPGEDPQLVPVEDAGLIQGVAVGPDGRAYAAGLAGDVFERTDAGWRRRKDVPETRAESLHAAWVAPDGALWAVGGNVLGALDRGVILRLGLGEVRPFRQPPLPPPAATACPSSAIDPTPDASIARRWNEQILNAIRRDIPRPPVHARNLWHLALAMWDAWAAYDAAADGYLVDEKHTAADVAAARQEAISYAAYRVLAHRYADPIAVGFATSQDCFAKFMTTLGYDPADETTVGNSPRALGNRIGQAVIDFGTTDGANEQNNYADTTGWMPTNTAMIVDAGGNTLADPSVWQQLNLAEAETQNGIPVSGGVQGYIGAHWREVKPFAMTRATPESLYTDPGPPPTFGSGIAAQLVDVIRRHSKLDPALSDVIDISPGAYGNNPLGTNAGTGHPVNPATGAPYAANPTKLGDFARVLAEFWADGPRSETPPGHWNTIANEVAEHPLHVPKLFGTGEPLDELEWDVKVYFALNAATHDAAIAAWELKRAYLASRPICWIRYMASLGQSSDPALPSYDPQGLPLVPGLIELVTAETAKPGGRHAHLRRYLHQLAVLSWRGEPGNRTTEVGGVGWVRAAEWMPYQRRTFVTPGFPGFVSGHSTFSRAAAEVLTELTGDAYFPGGLGEFAAPVGAYLVFERGPSAPTVLQWGTYYDAADQAGQSRLWGGIHIEADDLAGRVIGSTIGHDAVDRARTYFDGTARP